MDNLTHSLAGAILGQMGLKTKTGLAMPTLIIAANLPDIDVVTLFLGGHQHLALRRGLTHGPIAMVLLPVLLWAAMLAWDKWRPSEKRLPVHKGWLLALAYIGTISHPALDWLNNYGIRLLEPFSSQWFYGDSIFIIDIWIWAVLIAGVWVSLKRERGGTRNWQRPAWISFCLVCAYIFANGAITGMSERNAFIHIIQSRSPQLFVDPNTPYSDYPELKVVASPVQIKFWQREILWRDEKNYGSGYIGLGLEFSLDTKGKPHGADQLTLLHVKMGATDGPSYLFWSRMPIVERDEHGNVIIRDQRFQNPFAGDRFTLKTTVKP